MKSEIYKQILNKVESAQEILITAHENPDGDAVASVCAIAEWLKSLNKNYYIYFQDYPEKCFYFLANIEKIETDKEKIPFSKIDLAIVLDCASLRRSMIEEEIKNNNFFIINIDHHISNNNYGELNLADAEAVSTTQVLYEFFKFIKADINRNIANCILTGIFTDSGNFAYAATNSQTFSVAGEMLMEGANARDILKYTEKNKDLATLKAWGFALSRLQFNKEYDIVYTVIEQKDLDRFGINKNNLEGLASFLNNLKDAKIVLVLYELGDGRIKGSFRTNRDDVDVSEIAEVLGGGGHKKAAGFEIEGRFEKTKEGWKII